MAFSFVLALCAQALLIQINSAQYLGAAPCAGTWGAPYAAEWDYGPAASLSASNGPGVAVATASNLLPAGVSVLSENTYEGTLAVEGALPFLGTVAFEGALPSAGIGAVAYSCGNGIVGITAEDNRAIGAAGAGIAGPLGYGAIGSPLAAAPLAAAGSGTWGAPYAATEQAYIPPASLAASNGPGLAISSISPLSPTGVAVQSENAYEGALAVGGAVPFLGTVAFDGALPTTGAGSVAYGCGNGAVGITAEDIGAISLGSIDGPLGYGSTPAAPFGIARSGWGCGAI